MGTEPDISECHGWDEEPPGHRCWPGSRRRRARCPPRRLSAPSAGCSLPWRAHAHGRAGSESGRGRSFRGLSRTGTRHWGTRNPHCPPARPPTPTQAWQQHGDSAPVPAKCVPQGQGHSLRKHRPAVEAGTLRPEGTWRPDPSTQPGPGARPSQRERARPAPSSQPRPLPPELLLRHVSFHVT